MHKKFLPLPSISHLLLFSHFFLLISLVPVQFLSLFLSLHTYTIHLLSLFYPILCIFFQLYRFFPTDLQTYFTLSIRIFPIYIPQLVSTSILTNMYVIPAADLLPSLPNLATKAFCLLKLRVILQQFSISLLSLLLSCPLYSGGFTTVTFSLEYNRTFWHGIGTER